MSEGYFVVHPDPNKGFVMKFDNGYSVSVQWGSINYANNKDNKEYSKVAEVLVSDGLVDISRGFPHSDSSPNVCKGWLKPEQVAEILAWAAGKKEKVRKL
jgi:hypothetical protein